MLNIIMDSLKPYRLIFKMILFILKLSSIRFSRTTHYKLAVILYEHFGIKLYYLPEVWGCSYLI